MQANRREDKYLSTPAIKHPRLQNLAKDFCHRVLDSNIILSQYILDDVFRQSNALILHQPDLTFITGFISVIEVKSMIGRLWRNQQIHFKPEIQDLLLTFSEPTQVNRLAEYCFRNVPVKIERAFIPEKVTFTNIPFTLDADFGLAFRFASVLMLRTLDLIQLASAMNLKLHGKIPLDYFLTNDQMILDNRGEIRNTTRIVAISSEDLLNLLNLSS